MTNKDIKQKSVDNIPQKTMTKEARDYAYEQGYYRNGECPKCGDYICDDGTCMYCDFVSNLTITKQISNKPQKTPEQNQEYYNPKYSKHDLDLAIAEERAKIIKDNLKGERNRIIEMIREDIIAERDKEIVEMIEKKGFRRFEDGNGTELWEDYKKRELEFYRAKNEIINLITNTNK